MSEPISLQVRADGWTLELDACPPTRVNRMDFALGMVLYAFGGTVVGYYGLVFGLMAGHALVAVAGGPGWLAEVIAVGVCLVPVCWVGWIAALDVLRRQVRYRVQGRGAGLSVEVDRGRGALLPMPARSLGAVVVPQPWPAALSGTADDLLIQWTAVRGADLAPDALSIELSGDRRLLLWLRGQDLERLVAVVELVREGMRPGGASDVPEELKRLVTQESEGGQAS